jgi:hemolysin III
MRTVETRSVPSRKCTPKGFDSRKGLLLWSQSHRERKASEITSAGQIQARSKPRLRGVFHEFGFFAAVGLAIPLTIVAEPGRARISAIVFSSSIAACFGVSALYHRPTWSPAVRSWLARADHAGVYLLIAGTYTPFGLIVFSRTWAIVVLSIVYSGVAAAIALKVAWVKAPKWLSAAIGIALGWLGVAAYSQFAKVGAPGILLLFAGGLFYTAGAIVYALRRPDPRPAVLGYHEIFHLCTLAAAACQYAAIAFYVLPRG